jgi:YesN/AraC family two-component response regulator
MVGYKKTVVTSKEKNMKIHMKIKRRSISQQVLVINTVLSFLFVCIFLLNFYYVSQKSAQEAQRYSKQILHTVVQNFNSETTRLTTFIEMCKKDRSFVIALSNKLTIKAFVEYGKETSEKLSVIKYALPYSNNIYAYVKNNEKFIFSQDVILDKDIFASQLQKNLMTTEPIPDFGNMKDGFLNYSGATLYVTNLNNYGAIIIQIDPVKFCSLNELSSILPNYEMVVIDQENEIFAASSKEVQEIIKFVDLENNKPQKITYEKEKYEIAQETTRSGFRFILVQKASTLQKIQSKNNLLYIFAAGLVFIVCGLLIFLNTKIYSPLKKIAKTYGVKGSKQNEIEMISVKMNEIISENTLMQKQLFNNQTMQMDIELNYAIHSKQGVSEQMAEHLHSQYGHYRMMVIAIQNQTGGGEDLFMNVDNYLADTIEGKAIWIDQFVRAYIIPEAHEIMDIKSLLEKYFSNTKPTTMVFIGLSEITTNFMRIHEAYQQSYERLLSNTISLQKRLAISTSDSNTSQNIPATISFEVQNTIAKYTLSGSAKNLEEALEHIFFSNPSIQLKDFIYYYSQLAGLLLILLNSANNVMEDSDFKSTQKLSVYHPVYMFYILLDDYKKMNAGSSQLYSSLRYEIMGYLAEHYKEALSLESISAVFGITPVYLSSWFKKNTGINLSVYLSNIRMEEAKKLLVGKEHLKITDIATQVGIPGVSAFIRQFKNYTGSTPDQYRQIQHNQTTE